MRYKKLLAIVLLSLSFCFVLGTGSFAMSIGEIYGHLIEGESSLMEPIETNSSELIKAKRMYTSLPERYTLLVVLREQEEVLSMLWPFLSLYPEAEIPEEFALILPSGINNVEKIRKERWQRSVISILDLVPEDLILGLLLTMAYQQGYEIEDVTSNYIILIKPVYEEELKEWKERLNE